ncbi:unnamed protein product, partial [Mesorhabditis belari]|uniref:Uncharacterized protein n=1 Tax=Mesorhabditis belari TaxID=2138241 RepID=A0AAF3FLY6_9BILA
MRVCQLLFLGVLLILTANEARAEDECTKGFPFACFVHLWEKETNAGKEFVHAFNTEAFFDAHCKDVEKCNTDCPTTLTKVNKTDVRNKAPHKRAHLEDNTTETEAPPAPAPSDGDSFVPDLVEIQTIVLPICRREDTEKDCMALTSGHFCTITETSVQYIAHEYLPWNDIKDICTIVESPLGGESPKWFAEHVKNKKENMGSMKTVWEYTGFPFDIVTNKSSPFLAHRHGQGTKNCKKYAENTENCLPLPIWHAKLGRSRRAIINVVSWTSNIYHLIARTRRKSGSTGRNKTLNLHEVTTEKAQPARRGAAANLATPTRYYSRPIDLETVNEEDYADIESNYWLSTNRNPFYKKYGDKIKLAKASMCTFDSKETFCRSPPTTPNSNANNTRQNFQETSSLMWWAILLIVLACLVVLCFIILLIASSIGASVWLFCLKKKRRTKDRTGTKPTQPTKELQTPLLEKSTALDVPQTGQTAI